MKTDKAEAPVSIEEMVENAKTKMSFSRFDPYKGEIRCSVLRLCDRLEALEAELVAAKALFKLHQ